MEELVDSYYAQKLSQVISTAWSVFKNKNTPLQILQRTEYKLYRCGKQKRSNYFKFQMKRLPSGNVESFQMS